MPFFYAATIWSSRNTSALIDVNQRFYKFEITSCYLVDRHHAKKVCMNKTPVYFPLFLHLYKVSMRSFYKKCIVIKFQLKNIVNQFPFLFIHNVILILLSVILCLQFKTCEFDLFVDLDPLPLRVLWTTVRLCSTLTLCKLSAKSAVSI